MECPASFSRLSLPSAFGGRVSGQGSPLGSVYTNRFQHIHWRRGEGSGTHIRPIAESYPRSGVPRPSFQQPFLPECISPPTGRPTAGLLAWLGAVSPAVLMLRLCPCDFLSWRTHFPGVFSRTVIANALPSSADTCLLGIPPMALNLSHCPGAKAWRASDILGAAQGIQHSASSHSLSPLGPQQAEDRAVGHKMIPILSRLDTRSPKRGLGSVSFMFRSEVPLFSPVTFAVH